MLGFPSVTRNIAALALALAVIGCVDTRGSDAFVGDKAGFPLHPPGIAAALYLPNRVFDALDLVHAGVGIGPCLGLELQCTRPLSLSYAEGWTFGLGWFGRKGEWLQFGHYRRKTFSPEPDTSIEQARLFHVPFWDVSVQVHALAAHAYAGIAPFDELADFVTGLAAYDLKGDDF